MLEVEGGCRNVSRPVARDKQMSRGELTHPSCPFVRDRLQFSAKLGFKLYTYTSRLKNKWYVSENKMVIIRRCSVFPKFVLVSCLMLLFRTCGLIDFY